MSIKAVIQFFILLLIMAIVGIVYLKYFDTKQSIVEEIDLSEKKRDEQLERLESQIEDLQKKIMS